MPQAYYQIVQSMAHNTTLHQGGIFGKSKSVSPPVQDYKVSNEAVTVGTLSRSAFFTQLLPPFAPCPACAQEVGTVQ
jgi:hypothetical protein